MSTIQSQKKKTASQHISPLMTIGIITILLLVLAGVGTFIGFKVRDVQIAQQTQMLMQSKPVTNITTIHMIGSMFTPANVQVKVGTTVTWINQDSVPHSVTFKNGMKDSGTFAQGQSFHYTFTRVGTFTYYCTVHSEMFAQVIVVQ